MQAPVSVRPVVAKGNLCRFFFPFFSPFLSHVFGFVSFRFLFCRFEKIQTSRAEMRAEKSNRKLKSGPEVPGFDGFGSLVVRHATSVGFLAK